MSLCLNTHWCLRLPQGVWGDQWSRRGRHSLSCGHTVPQKRGQRQGLYLVSIQEEAMWCQVLYLLLHIILNTLLMLLHNLLLYFLLDTVLYFYWYRIVHGLCCSLFLSLSGIRTWLLSVRSLCPPTLPLRTTPGGRFSVLASPSWSSPVSSPRLAKPEGHAAQTAHILAQSVKAMELLVVFCFRSPTTTRPHRVSCPTSPQTSPASPPPSAALSVPVAISWRPIRTAKLPCQY